MTRIHPASRRARVIALLLGAVAAAGCATGADRVVTTRTLTLTESGSLTEGDSTRTLIVESTPDGEPVAYAMDVRSVYCLSAECEVISVRLQWDPLGRYERYDVPDGENLTKNDHEAFGRRDHRILHELLRDPTSQVRRVDPEQFLKAVREAGEDGGAATVFDWQNPEYLARLAERADAVSTPTPVDLKELVVPGAAYTSLALWNWANGEVPRHIRTITRDTASRRQLLGWLGSDQPDPVRFALDALEHRRMFDASTVAAVLDRADDADGDWLRMAWPYLDASTTEPAGRLAIYARLVPAVASTQRAFLLERLGAERGISEAWFEALAPSVDAFDTYYEVHLYLGLLAEHEARSAAVVSPVIGLLDHENAFIARRAFDYLRRLPESEQLDDALARYRERTGQ